MENKENARKKRQGAIAVAAGVALLLGGSSYALWSATDSVDAGQVISGNLKLEAAGDSSLMADISADRFDSSNLNFDSDTTELGPAINFTLTDGQKAIYNGVGLSNGIDGDGSSYGLHIDQDNVLVGHLIDDPTTWKMVPGDTVASFSYFTVTLEGDNLVAKLTLDATALLEDEKNTDMVYTVALFDTDGKQIGAFTPLDTSKEALPVAVFRAPSDGQGQGAEDDWYRDSKNNGVVVPVADGTVGVYIAVLAHFKDTGENQKLDNVNVTDKLGAITANLTQVRGGTDNFGGGEKLEDI
ncbi:MAG: SipW-dependent-type signal peptide-containing protein [Propionibacteriaceae bacterium]|jgi:predicted ribosomally synthesized peptide with SipW-like signal peptide|nr:SipW-dependent-type signal peptide-containing protein [Propionibacteriaceae bacterium]